MTPDELDALDDRDWCGQDYADGRALVAEVRRLRLRLELARIGFNALYEAHKLINFDTEEDTLLQGELLASVEPSRAALGVSDAT